MIDITRCFWFVAGLLAGFLHASMLWRAAHQLKVATPVLGMLRLGSVAAVLVAAALFAAILAAAVGWAVGIVTLSMWLMGSRANRTVSPDARANE